MSATPRPWRVGEVTWEGDGTAGVLVNAGDEVVAFCTTWTGTFRPREDEAQPRDFANAALIVQRVNAFAALLAVAKAAALPDDLREDTKEYRATMEALRQLDAAAPGWREWDGGLS